MLIGAMVLFTACPETESEKNRKSGETESIVTTDTSETELVEESSSLETIDLQSLFDSTTETSDIAETSETDEVATTPETTESETSATTEETTIPATVETTVEEPVEKGFVVHFIDVGQGDASLIICDGEAMLIDGGASDKSDLIYAYLKKYDISHLKYIVGTHPDDDHIGGLSGALNYAKTERAFCSVDVYDSEPFSNFQKYLNQQRVVLEVPKVGTKLDLGSAKAEIIAPRVKNQDTNNNSIVIRIVYGNTSFLFTGDAEFDEENTILNARQTVSSDVLKVGHHGSEYSTSERFLEAVAPALAIISCGNENAYGFPTQTVLDELKTNGVTLLRTDKQGDILVRSDGETITYETEKETSDDLFLAPGTIESIETIPDGSNDCSYIANTNTKKFHDPGCSAVHKMKEKNKWYYEGSREDLIALGYAPCKICNP